MLADDQFLVVKLDDDMLAVIRRTLYREATRQLEQDALRETSWLLLKRMDNLDDKRDEPRRLLPMS